MISVDKTTPEVNKLPSLEQLGISSTTLQKSRAAASAPLAPIDYNVRILNAPTAAPACPMASQPCLLTPAQAALVHALGTVQGRAHTMHVQLRR